MIIFTLPLKVSKEKRKNGCSYFVLSLVTIEIILRLHRCLVLAANFGLCQTENRTLTAELVNMSFENSLLNDIFG